MVVTDRFLRKPTRDITVNIFPTSFFYFRKVFFISARLFLFPQGFFYFRKVCLFPQGFVHFRKVCFISARLYYFRKIYFVSAMLFLFPRGLFLFRKVGFRNLALANANISTILFEVRKPTRDITVNIFSARFFISARFFFFISARFFFYFRKVFFISARLFFISARFVLFPQGLLISARFCSFPQGLFHFRKVILFPQGLFYFRKVIFISPRFHRSSSQFGSRQCQYLRKPTRDITVNIFPQGFFYFRKVCFITARFVLLISARFCSFPQGLFHFRKVILFPQGLFHFRKVIFISPRFHRSSSQFGSRQCQYLYTIVRSAPLRQMTWAYPYPGGYHWKYFREN